MPIGKLERGKIQGGRVPGGGLVAYIFPKCCTTKCGATAVRQPESRQLQPASGYCVGRGAAGRSAVLPGGRTRRHRRRARLAGPPAGGALRLWHRRCGNLPPNRLRDSRETGVVWRGIEGGGISSALYFSCLGFPTFQHLARDHRCTDKICGINFQSVRNVKEHIQREVACRSGRFDDAQK